MLCHGTADQSISGLTRNPGHVDATPNPGMMDFVIMGKSGEILPKLLGNAP